LPAPFAEIVRRCLNNDPRNRPTIRDLEDLLNPPPPAPSAAPQPERSIEAARPIDPPRSAIRELPRQAAARIRPPIPPWLVPAVVGFAIFMAVWFSFRAMHSRAATQAPAAAQSTSTPLTAAAPQAPTASSPASASAVLHEEIPTASRGARQSIRGQIKVVVRVTVDRSGNVTGENTEVRGSSRYFNRLAAEAAKKWKFAPADNASPRDWQIQFEFTREGISAHAAQRGRQ
jgi:TonB family protein